MEEILAKAHASTAYATIVTMVDGFALTIFPQMANITVIVSGFLATVNTHIGSLLWCCAKHAEHVSGLCTNEVVVFIRIVAETACIPFLTSEALQFDIPFVVLASKRLFSFRCHLIRFHGGFASMSFRQLHRHESWCLVLLAQDKCLLLCLVLPELQRP